MPVWLLPSVLAVFIGGAWYKVSRKPEAMNEDTMRIFNSAIVNLEDPVALRTLAGAFASAGFREQAGFLQKRAELFGASADLKADRQELFKRALDSKKPDGVLAAAQHFEDIGAVGAADELRVYAAGLVKALSTPLPSSPVAGANVATTPMGPPPANHATDGLSSPPISTAPTEPSSPSSTASNMGLPTTPKAVANAVEEGAKAISSLLPAQSTGLPGDSSGASPLPSITSGAAGLAGDIGGIVGGM